MQDQLPDIFLCHNRADKPWVRNLGTRLEAESIDGLDKGRRIRVFFDEWDIEKGENIVTRLGKELASGAYVAVVMSPEFFESSWTAFEWTDVVARDPVNKAGRLLPIRRRDVSLDGGRRIVFPAPFNALSAFDFRSEHHFEPAFQELLRRLRNQPPQRGRQIPARYSAGAVRAAEGYSPAAVAENVDEILLSNLAPIVDSPPHLYFATTNLRSLSEIPSAPEFEDLTVRIANGKIFTFADLEDPECRLNSIVDPYTIERRDFATCLEDVEMTNEWLALANKILARALLKKSIGQDSKSRFFFYPTADGSDRLVTIGSEKPRAVAARKKHHATGQEFWVHYAASIRFRLIGSAPFLRVLPSYSFTKDGYESLDHQQAGRYRIIWGGKQDSASVLRHVLFWLRYLSSGREDIVLETGGDIFRISMMPATAPISVGIGMDHTRIKALIDEPAADEDELDAVADSAAITDLGEEPQDESDDFGGATS